MTDLDHLRDLPDGPDLLSAVQAFVAAQEALIRDARHVRDAYIRRLVRAHGVAETARRAQLSATTVKQIRDRA